MSIFKNLYGVIGVVWCGVIGVVWCGVVWCGVGVVGEKRVERRSI